MAEKDKKFYWLKLKTEFMNGEVVDFLMSQKNGANYVVLYEMLAIKTMNTNGRLCSEIGGSKNSEKPVLPVFHLLW